jgi:anthranilate phosphoribosyltransferase
MPLRKEMLDLLSDVHSSQTVDEQISWAKEAMNTLIASAEDPGNHISIAGFLASLQVTGVQGGHLAGFAAALRRLGRSIDFGSGTLIDTCGTGGGSPSFNISTGAALLAAGAGAKVAKHGNRAVTSRSGSADVLASLGIGITPDEDKLQECMARAGFAFLFAPYFYETMKNLAPIRGKLGIRTVFNQLGPLLNPAGAKRQMIGVYDLRLVIPMANALHLLDSEKSLIVHGEDGLDEISPSAPTTIMWSGQNHRESWKPEDFGFARLSSEAITPGDSADDSARMVIEGLSRTDSVAFRALLPSAATAISLSLGLERADAVARAKEAVDSGAALRMIEVLREVVPA